MSRIYKISLLLAFFPAVAFTGEFLSLDLRNFSVSHQKFDSTPKIDSNYLILKKLPDGLYAAPYELTQRQWELVMGDRPSFFCNDKYYADRPVECVSYDNALKFLEVISVKSGIKFVLPTMEEWEYAARAGTEGDFTDGSKMLSPDHDKALDRLARYYYTGGKGAMRDSDTSSGTAKVGSYAPNAWGLYDMLGNVREWALGDAKCGTRMFTRGGAWALNAKKSSISKFEYFLDRTSDSPTSGLRVFSRLEKFEGAAQLPPYEKVSPYKGPMIAPDDREGALRLWKKYMDPPAEYLNFEKKIILVKKCFYVFEIKVVIACDGLNKSVLLGFIFSIEQCKRRHKGDKYGKKQSYYRRPKSYPSGFFVCFYLTWLFFLGSIFYFLFRVVFQIIF